MALQDAWVSCSSSPVASVRIHPRLPAREIPVGVVDLEHGGLVEISCLGTPSATHRALHTRGCHHSSFEHESDYLLSNIHPNKGPGPAGPGTSHRALSSTRAQFTNNHSAESRLSGAGFEG